MSARPDLDRLAALAAAATPGPWSNDVGYIVGQVPGGRPGGEVIFNTNYVNGVGQTRKSEHGNSEYVAACDPATLTWLVERVRECENVLPLADEAVRRARWFVSGHSWPGAFMPEATNAETAFDKFAAARAALSDTEQSR